MWGKLIILLLTKFATATFVSKPYIKKYNIVYQILQFRYDKSSTQKAKYLSRH